MLTLLGLTTRYAAEHALNQELCFRDGLRLGAGGDSEARDYCKWWHRSGGIVVGVVVRKLHVVQRDLHGILTLTIACNAINLGSAIKHEPRQQLAAGGTASKDVCHVACSNSELRATWLR